MNSATLAAEPIQTAAVPSSEHWRRLGLGAVLLGALVRLLMLAVHPPSEYVYSDMLGYVSRAEALVAGAHLVPYDAAEAPGTHILLALPIWIFGAGHPGLVAAGWLWWLLSSLIPLATWHLARRLVGPRTAVLAAALAAFDPLMVSYGGYFTSEIPVTCLLLSSLALAYGAQRSRRPMVVLVLAGFLGGAAVVVRPQVIINLAVFVLALRPWLANRRALAAFACGLALPLAGASWYSSTANGRLSFVATNGGLNFFQAQCHVHLLHLSWSDESYEVGSPVSMQLNRGGNYEYRGVAPWDQSFFYHEGLHCFDRAPLTGIADALRNVADLTVTTVPFPQANELALGRIADAGNVLYCGALAIALCALAYRRRRHGPLAPPIKALLWQLATILPIALAFGGEPRYRFPYDPFGLILIAYVIVALARRLVSAGAGISLASQPAED